jgi:DNA-binding CsgD family transcriptional regulator
MPSREFAALSSELSALRSLNEETQGLIATAVDSAAECLGERQRLAENRLGEYIAMMATAVSELKQRVGQAQSAVSEEVAALRHSVEHLGKQHQEQVAAIAKELSELRRSGQISTSGDIPTASGPNILPAGLSKRERDVLGLLTPGMTNLEMAEPLEVSQHQSYLHIWQAGLNEREQDIVGLVASGMTNREIAERLGVSQHTVQNYLRRIFDKLGVSTRVGLVSFFFRSSQEPTGKTASRPSGHPPEDPLFRSK